MKTLESLIPANIAEAIGGALMHALWQLSAIAIVLLLTLAFMRKHAPRLRYALSVSALALMLVIPFVTFGLLFRAAPPTFSTKERLVVQSPLQFSHESPKQANSITIPQRRNAEVATFFTENAYLFLGLWILGMSLLTARFMGGFWQTQRLRNRYVQDVPDALMQRFENLLQQVGIRNKVGLRYSTVIHTPMVIGALKPIVLLPVGLLSGLSMEQVECILIHELAHVRRWDYLVNVAQSMAEIVLFFHPATWWVSKMIRQEREICCDEMVVQMSDGKQVLYARALLQLELQRQKQPTFAMSSQDGDLASRIRRITGATIVAKRQLNLKALLLGFLIIGCILLLATQSKTVLKAALPFFKDATIENVDSTSAKPQKDAGISNLTSSKSDVDKNSVTTAIQSLAAMLGQLNFNFAQQDSPITKVTMNDRGEEVVLSFDKTGTIASATRNGKEVPKEDLPEYQELAFSAFHRSQKEEIPPIPPMASMKSLPAIPRIPPLDAMPPLPFLGNLGNEEDAKKFEKEMEEFGARMGAWGEQYAAQFKSQDWDAYGKEMEKWAEGFASGLIAEESAESKEIQAEMDRIQSNIENAKNDKERKSLEAEMDELSARLGEMQGAAIEKSMEGFGTRMEAWGERYAAQMERFAEEQARNTDALEAEMEAIRDRAEAEADRAQEEADEEGERATNAANSIGEAMVQDGLISDAHTYKLKINEKEFFVNGKKQSETLHGKYCKLVSRLLGEVGNEWVTIQHKGH